MTKREQEAVKLGGLLHRLNTLIAEMLGDDPETTGCGSTIVVDGVQYRWDMTIQSNVPNPTERGDQ